MFQQRGQFRELCAFASIHQQRGARKIALARGVQLRKNRNEFDRQVIDTVEAHVFERAKDSGFSRTGKTGENNELAGFVSESLLHGEALAAQLFTLR